MNTDKWINKRKKDMAIAGCAFAVFSACGTMAQPTIPAILGRLFFGFIMGVIISAAFYGLTDGIKGGLNKGNEIMDGKKK